MKKVLICPFLGAVILLEFKLQGDCNGSHEGSERRGSNGRKKRKLFI